MMSCPFCDQEVSLADGVFLENALAYVREDKFPISSVSLLFILGRLAVEWFDLSADEQAAVADLINRAKCGLDEQHRTDGYNIGMNCGRAAVLTVMHMHCHLIPRYHGDVDDPRGDLRGASAGKQRYD